MRKVLESERLTLHRLTRQDTDFVIELLNDESLVRYIGDRACAAARTRSLLSPDAEEVNLHARETGVVVQARAGNGMTKWMANKGARTGVFFGATSGVITTIGLIVGLYAGTRSLVAVLGGILVIAVADAMSDALGIHLAQESDPESTHEHIWSATAWTFLSKLIVAASFALPLIWLPLGSAVLVSVIWGLLVITALSVYLARAQQNAVLPVVAEHVLIAIAVVGVSHLIGRWVSTVAA